MLGVSGCMGEGVHGTSWFLAGVICEHATGLSMAVLIPSTTPKACSDFQKNILILQETNDF